MNQSPIGEFDITPKDGDADVELGSPIVLSFPRPLDPETVDVGQFIIYANGVALGNTVRLSSDCRILTLTLQLPPASTVTLTTGDNLRDLDGETYPSTRVQFSTVAKSTQGDPGYDHRNLDSAQWIEWFHNDRFAAAEAIYHLDAACIPVLVELLRHGDGQVDMAARSVLAKIGDPVCLPLAETMKSAGDRAQSLIAVVFTWIGTGTIPILLNLLDSENARERRGALVALNAFGTRASMAETQLYSLLHGAALDTETEKLLVDTLWNLGPDEKKAAQLYKFVRSRADIPGLSQRLRSDDRQEALAAARELGKARANPDAAIPLLIRTLKDGTADEKLSATAALQEYGPLAASAIEPLIVLLRKSEVSDPTWLSGDGNPKRALVMMGPEVIDSMKRLLYEAPEIHLRRRAARILGALLEEATETEVNRRLAGYKRRIREREPEVLVALRKAALEDTNESVRSRAAKGLAGARSTLARIHHIEVLLETARFEDGWTKLDGPISSWTNLESRLTETFRQCDQESHEQLIALTDRFGISREALTQSLARSLDARTAPPGHVASTLLALSRFGEDARAVHSRVRALIEHEDPQIRTAAQTAVARIS